MMNEQLLDEESNGSSSISLMAEEENYPPYELAADEIEIPIQDGRETFAIICKRPTRAQHEKRARMSVIVKRTAAKVDDQDAVTVTSDTGRADEVFVRAVALRVKGYQLREGDNPEQELDAQQILDANEFLTEEEIDNWQGERVKGKTLGERLNEGDPVVRVIDLIPATHMKVVANDLFGGSFEVDKAKKRVLSSRARRINTVTQKLGVHALEDATMSKPSHLVRWRFKDPDFAAIGKFDSKAVTGTTVFLSEKNGGGQEERRIVSLDTVESLFDSNIEGAENAVVKGEEFSAKDSAHLRAVDLGLKKSLVMMLFNKIQAESGNSSAPSSHT
jgi:hypothetical protein